MSIWDDLRDRVISSTDRTERQELDKSPPIASGGVQKGKTPSEGVSRIDKGKLERKYYDDPTVHNAVNFYVRNITGEDFTILPTDETDDNDLHRIRQFVERSGLRTKLGGIMRDLGIYGNAFMEIIWNKKGDKVVNLVPLDPKQMSFIKTKERGGKEKIATGEMGKPIGYIQKTNSYRGEANSDRYMKIASQFDNINNDKIKVEKGIPFHRDEIVHFRLQKLSDTLMGVGLIEPVYDIVDMKMDIEDAIVDGVARASRPDLVGKVGTFDENEPVRANDTDALKKGLEQMRTKQFGVVSIPEYWDVDQLDTDIGGLDEYHRIFMNLSIIGMGLPPSLLSAQSVGSKGAEVKNALTEKVMQAFQNSISFECRDQIFRTILEKDLSEIPRMIWKELNPLTKGMKSRRISELARAGLITRDRELEEHLRELEGLPPLPEESDEAKDVREKEGQKRADRAARSKLSLDEPKRRTDEI